MSKLEELIQELCPNGVEYKTLGEIATIARGGNFQKKDYCEVGVPCIHYGQIYTQYGLFTDSTLSYISPEVAKKQKMAMPNDIIMAVTSENIDDVCKCVAWLGAEQIAVSGHTAIIHHNQNTKFLTYYFHTAMFHEQKRKLAHGTKVIEVTPNKLNGIKIPIPPLPVQSEIVRILDNFTELTAELQEELQEELQARKKQYEYYKSNLLSFETRTPYKSLSDVADVFDSLHQTPEYIQSGFSMIRVQDIKGAYIDTENTLKVSKEVFSKFVKKYRPQKDDIIVSRVGSYGNFALVPNDDCCLGQNVAIIHPNICKRFLFYILNSLEVKQWIDKNVKGASQKSFSLADIRRIPIPIPSLEEQARIVSILDRFDALCNDLTSGLPAEIEARQKQYEYYRDKLLSFHPLSQP